MTECDSSSEAEAAPTDPTEDVSEGAWLDFNDAPSQAEAFDLGPDRDQIAVFVDVVFGYCEGLVPVRGFVDKGQNFDVKPHNIWLEADKQLAERAFAFATWAGQKGVACYVIPGTVDAYGKAKAADVRQMQTVLVDLDTGDTGARLDHLIKHLGNSTLVVESGGVTDAGPLIERQVGGDDGRATLIALAEDLEQELGAGWRERDITEFVPSQPCLGMACRARDDQEFDLGKLALEAKQALLIARFDQFMNESGGCHEADRKTFLAGGQAKTQGDMRLAGAGIADRDDVLPALNVRATRQLQNQQLVERRQGREVIAVQALHCRETGGADAALDQPTFAIDQFQLDKTRQISDVIDAFAGALCCNLLIFAQERRKLEGFEVMVEQNLRGLVHAALSDSKAR